MREGRDGGCGSGDLAASAARRPVAGLEGERGSGEGLREPERGGGTQAREARAAALARGLARASGGGGRARRGPVRPGAGRIWSPGGAAEEGAGGADVAQCEWRGAAAGGGAPNGDAPSGGGEVASADSEEGSAAAGWRGAETKEGGRWRPKMACG
nr:circumsporozoite protein-like [Aegilops tauschii subsp. strangulata]